MKKNWIISVILIIASGVLVSNYGGTIPYALFYFSILIPITSFIYIVIVWDRFRFSQVTGKRVLVKGEPVDYLFSLENQDQFIYSGIKAYFFHDNSYIVGINEMKEFCLMPGEREEVKTNLCCRYRGRYFVGVKYFVITDYLHLFNIAYEVPSQLPVTVLPRIVEWKDSDVIDEDKDEKNTISSMREEEQIDIQVRQYVTGDPMRQVHWKLSAKAGKLMTRIHHASVKLEVMIIMDLSPIGIGEEDKLLLEDGIIEETLAAANYCYKKKIPCFVCFEQNGYNRLPIQTINEWDEFYMLCAKFSFIGNMPSYELCETSKQWLKTVKHAIIITHELNIKLYNILKSSYTGIEVCILLIISALGEKEKKRIEFFEEKGVTVRLITFRKDGKIGN
ncbi:MULTISPECIES: DUF58 domain-containing protein [unclassified Clostridium]|uniref:DUF58 domain-containing protein n=1 Tax=unclassified Clostridium TaxID=2614128 RepID=UPI0002980A0D|nr:MULTISPECIES: DUF58 domain-containing protein [unclassified Clostridium]EKQ55190.1 MAG: hypothetical protein A370_02751 [Clostridium sp. Maddingley MBC34-26]